MLFPMINVLYFYISSLQSLCAVPNMAVLLFPDVMLSRCCSGIYQIILRWFQLPLINGNTFVFTFHMQCISTVYIYSKVFSDSFFITYLAPKIATAINTHVPFLL